jgi:hypothetical protein
MKNAGRATEPACPPDQRIFKVRPPLLCPYHNLWGRNVYELRGAFRHNPFTIPASSTSGSPLVIDADGKCFGFMNGEVVEGAEFAYDGRKTLTVSVPEGQRLWADESGQPESWRHYNRAVLSGLPAASRIREAWCDIEYCTWVEQKAVALETGCHPFDVLTHDFVADYIERIAALGLPRGKLTVDHGWQNGDTTYGDWEVHPRKFEDLQRTADIIRDNGFTPGLWMAPIWLHPLSHAAGQHPEWMGPPIVAPTPDSPVAGDWHYFRPALGVMEHLQEIFTRYHRMGFMKFKFDMIYAEKHSMRMLHQLVYRAVKNVSDVIEVEIHQPDIFFTTCCDAVRTNDVLCNDEYPCWRNLTKAHMDICEKSAAGRVINLDHIGGNDPSISAQSFLDHIDLYRDAVGHPVVSLLPGHLGKRTVKGLQEYLHGYAQHRNAVSRYL